MSTAFNRTDEQALAEQVRELQELNAAKDKFLSLLSHDLRNPMTGIKGYASLLRANVAGDKPQRWLGVMIDQIDFMTRFINDLLDILRFDEHRLELALEPVDLRGLVAAEAEAAKKTAATRGVTLAVELPAGPVMVEAETPRLANAVRHLVDNAVKFAGDGGRVEVQLAAELGSARLTIEDDGPGVMPERKPYLFDKLQGAYWTDRLEEQGSGLGLPVAYRLIAAHRGALELESEFGRGCRAVMRLPLAQGRVD